MCGIAGELRFESASALDLWVRAACRLMEHRGPDGEGIHVDGQIALGHRRLSIIDIEGGKQPLSYADGRYWITYNGEIYNYRELRHELIASGRTFITHSDTEVILAAYDAWGLDCLPKFNGIFAFAIWDSQQHELVLARDHLGVKPLLYHYDNTGIRFGSELKVLLAHPSVKAQIDDEALQDYLALGYVMSPRSIVKGVCKLPPAHYLLVRGNRITISSYWNLAEFFNDVSWHGRPRPELLRLFDEALADSIRSQMVSDVPVAAFLSGGLDSTSVVYFAARERPIKTFSMGFSEETYCELNFARMAADFLHAEHYWDRAEPQSLEAIAKLIWFYDEPLGDTSIIPTYFVSRLARGHVKVVLSGDGADELLAGYDTYFADMAQRFYCRLPNWLHRLVVTPAVNMIPPSQHKVSLGFRIKQFVCKASGGYQRAHFGWREMFNDDERDALTGRKIIDYHPFETYARYYEDVKDNHWLHQSLYVDLKTWLPDDILAKVDRASMANSLESRVPFLSPRLVELTARLPADLKMNGVNRKYILRKLMADRIPDSIRKRTKRGFNAPVALWMRSKQAEEIESLLTKEESRVIDLRHPAVDKIWREHKTGAADHGFKLWTLLSLLLWEKKVLNQV